ncbi:MAG: FAD-dependent hydroxylase [Synechococcales bacterium]|nr:FAD-dependent hydroxylase [Synechococcales bacterium]
MLNPATPPSTTASPEPLPNQSHYRDDSDSSSDNSSDSSSANSIDYDIAIVGGGIVGLTLACALKTSGLRVALIEAKPREAGLLRHRAYALTLLSGRIFEGLGVWGEILPQITTFQTIRLADAKHPTVIDLQPTDLGTQELGYVAEHQVLVQALYHCLEGATQVTWRCPAEVVSVQPLRDYTEVTLLEAGQPHTLRAQVLVAADGSRSPLRDRLGIQTTGWKYWQSCVTAVIRPEKAHGDIAREHFWPSGPFATLPLPDNRCQIVLTAPHAEAKRFLEMDVQDFLSELDRRYDHQLGRLELVGDRYLFPVQLMHSRQYVQPRLALVGDAAHCCHPVGGQGLNLGIRDAAALAQVLQAAHQRGEDLGSLAVLQRYQHWRRWENWIILWFTDLLDRSFSNTLFPILVARRWGLNLMARLGLLRSLALRLMTGLSGKLPDLAR